MKALAFELSGASAFFKKPDVNAHTYYTYGHIHKVALCGLLGALAGAGGNVQQLREGREFPEYYEMFWPIKSSIVPRNRRGYFQKRMHGYTNTTGFANLRDGSGGGLTLMVREQWLEHPHWTVYLLEDEKDPACSLIRERLFGKTGVYCPFLGQTNHPATISNVRELEVYAMEEEECYIDSLHPIQGEGSYEREVKEGEKPYFFKELSPIALHPELGEYVLEELVHTNLLVASEGVKDALFTCEGRILYFS